MTESWAFRGISLCYTMPIMTASPPLTLSTWDVALPDTGPTPGTVVDTFVYSDPHSHSSRPHLYVVGQVYSSRARKENAQLLSRVVGALKKECMRDDASSPATALNMGLARANEILKEARRSTFSAHTLKVNMVAVLARGETAYLSRTAQGVVLREREGLLEQVTERLRYSPDPYHHITFQRVIETRLMPHDTLFLGTPQLFKVGEAVLSTHSDANTLKKEVLASKNELRNLGLIAIYVGTGGAAPPSSPDSPTSSFAARWHPIIHTLRSRLVNHRPLLFAAVGAALLVLLLAFALPAEEQQVTTDHAHQNALTQIHSLEEKATTLIELENFDEASRIIEEVQRLLIETEQRYGPTPSLEEFKETARYLSSLIPIRE